MTTQPRDIVDRVLERLRAEVERACEEIADHVAGETAARLTAEHQDEMGRLRHELDARHAALEESTERRLAEAVSVSGRDTALAADLRAARAQAEDAVHALAEVENATRAGERDTALAGVDRLLAAVQQLDAAASLSEGLDHVAAAVAAEAERSMVLLVREAHLLGWRLSGFGPHAPAPTEVVVPLDEAGDLRSAVVSKRPTQVHPEAFGRETSPVLAFARLPESRIGLAVPVVVGDRAVAVVYADDGASVGAAVPGSWPEAVEIVARHAARCLEGLTVRQVAARRRDARVAGEASGTGDAPAAEVAGGAAPSALHGDEPSARRLAHLLVSEVMLFNEPTIRIGRDKRDLRVRLGTEIARARRAYEDQVPATVPRRAEVFEDELVQVLAGGDAALLGPDRTPAH